MSETEVLQKIKKLLALTSSSNEHEAALAMARVKDLLDKHQLSLSDVELFGTPENSTVTQDHYEAARKRTAAWMDALAAVIALYLDTKVYISRKAESVRYVYIGIPDDLSASIAMLEYLVASIEVMALQWNGGKKMAFKAGIVRGIAEQLKERKKVVPTTGTSLVIRKKDAIQKYMQNDNLRLRNRQGSKARYDGGAYSQGYNAGKSMNIHHHKSRPMIGS